MRRAKKKGAMKIQEIRAGRRYKEISKKIKQEDIWMRKRGKEKRGKL